MKRIISVFLVYVLSITQAHALAGVDYYGKVNNAVGSIISDKITKNGVPSEASVMATTAAAQTALTATATTVAVGVATGAVAAVGWPALLVAAGVGGVVTAGVSLGVNGLVQWFWPSEGSDQTKITVSPTLTESVPLIMLPAFPSSDEYLELFNTPGDYYFRADDDHGRHIKIVRFTCPGAAFGVFCGTSTIRVHNTLNSDMDSSSLPFDATVKYVPGYAVTEPFTSSQLTRTYTVAYNESRKISGQWLPFIDQESYPVTYRSKLQQPQESLADVPESYANEQLSDEQLAAIANAVWKHAANAMAAHPQAVPYPATSPITAPDIATWRQSHPEMVPTVRDFASPIAAPGTSVVPITAPAVETPPATDPEPDTDPGTTTPPATTVAINWGSLSPPALEATPTTASILDPIFSMWPQWNNFAFPAHASACPTPTFEALNHTFTFDHLCTWIEMIREPLQASFAIMWAFLVILIVMGA